eukprot:Rhum_TRINITY_DN8380_c0_g1::Rhum_TRINITY_DN8380_c0_g1_i1::g.27547::m.27547
MNTEVLVILIVLAVNATLVVACVLFGFVYLKHRKHAAEAARAAEEQQRKMQALPAKSRKRKTAAAAAAAAAVDDSVMRAVCGEWEATVAVPTAASAADGAPSPAAGGGFALFDDGFPRGHTAAAAAVGATHLGYSLSLRVAGLDSGGGEAAGRAYYVEIGSADEVAAHCRLAERRKGAGAAAVARGLRERRKRGELARNRGLLEVGGLSTSAGGTGGKRRDTEETCLAEAALGDGSVVALQLYDYAADTLAILHTPSYDDGGGGADVVLLCAKRKGPRPQLSGAEAARVKENTTPAKPKEWSPNSPKIVTQVPKGPPKDLFPSDQGWGNFTHG